jgi:hypothetical protein
LEDWGSTIELRPRDVVQLKPSPRRSRPGRDRITRGLAARARRDCRRSSAPPSRTDRRTSRDVARPPRSYRTPRRSESDPWAPARSARRRTATMPSPPSTSTSSPCIRSRSRWKTAGHCVIDVSEQHRRARLPRPAAVAVPPGQVVVPWHLGRAVGGEAEVQQVGSHADGGDPDRGGLRREDRLHRSDRDRRRGRSRRHPAAGRDRTQGGQRDEDADALRSSNHRASTGEGQRCARRRATTPRPATPTSAAAPSATGVHSALAAPRRRCPVRPSARCSADRAPRPARTSTCGCW